MNNQQKKKNSGASWAILIILIPLLMRALDGDLPPVVFGVIVIAAVAAIAFGKMAKNREKAAKNALESRGNGTKAAPGRKSPEVELHRPVPAMQRRESVTAQRSFPQPEAYCVSCELSGEDHFVRDRKRRIEPLDEWLKNGLIDREEYRVLKNRFEHDL